MAEITGTNGMAERQGYTAAAVSKRRRETRSFDASGDGLESPAHIPKGAKCPRPAKVY